MATPALASLSPRSSTPTEWLKRQFPYPEASIMLFLAPGEWRITPSTSIPGGVGLRWQRSRVVVLDLRMTPDILATSIESPS